MDGYISVSHWGMFPVHVHQWDNIAVSDIMEAYICRECLEVEERQIKPMQYGSNKRFCAPSEYDEPTDPVSLPQAHDDGLNSPQASEYLPLEPPAGYPR
jgi:hypothetical protein